MPDRNFLARPDQNLSAHLDGVGENARRLVAPDSKTTAGNSLHSLVDTIAQLHDIGKYTTFFQDYLTEAGRRRPTPRETHADVGAVLTYRALAAQGFSLDESLTGFYAVMRHHGGLPNLRSYQDDLLTDTKRFETLGEKLRNIDLEASAIVDARLSAATDGALLWSDILIDDPQVHRQQLCEPDALEGFYPLLLRNWSTLTCADKLNAAGITVDEAVARPDPEDIEFDDDASGVTSELNQQRTAAREQVVQAMQTAIDNGGGVYTLTLPTGFGKTFAGLEAALRAADRTDGRVVYALPYTTVIDQVHEMIRDQFGVSPESAQYTIHHHLVDTRTGLDDGQERLSTGAEALYGESWLSGLVLTTFVQLFESLAGPGNVQSIKLPALQDSVIVIDEPQALPRRWWHLISRLVTMLFDRYDARIILMTATQPRFIEEYNLAINPMELVDNPNQYFDFLARHERVRFEIDPSIRRYLTNKDAASLTVEDAAGRLLGQALTEQVDILAVNNTVRSAATLGQAVESEAKEQGLTVTLLGQTVRPFVARRGEALLETLRGEDSGPDLSALATEFLQDAAKGTDDPHLLIGCITAALRPIDRTLLIEAIRQLVTDEIRTVFNGVPLLVSATQLVEAGVDVSFDRVHRDFAPVPSLVQAAGRCNRSFERDIGTVTLWRLDGSDEGRPPSEQVYTHPHDRLEPSRTALRSAVKHHGDQIPEAEMVSSVVEIYYDELHESDHTSDTADQLVRQFDSVKGDDLRSASLIENDSEEFLVLTTGGDLDRLRTYLSEREGGSYGDGRAAFGALKHLFASYRTDDITGMDDRDEVLAELGYDDTSLEEFPIVDARGSLRYSIPYGFGLRPDAIR